MPYINDKQKRIIGIGLIATIIIVAIAFIIGTVVGSGNKNSDEYVDEAATVSNAQRMLLLDIKDSLSDGDMNKAAVLIRDNYNELENIYKLSGNQRVCIDGLLIIDRSTYYYGELDIDIPNGKGIAIRVYETDDWRYDYSKGEFKNGMLNGSAVTGYSYIRDSLETASNADSAGEVAEKEASSNNVIAVERSGDFTDDIMDSSIIMKIYYSDGLMAEYNIITDKGTTDISNWEYMESENKYQIRAVNNNEYVYELTKDESSQLRWKSAVSIYEDK